MMAPNSPAAVSPVDITLPPARAIGTAKKSPGARPGPRNWDCAGLPHLYIRRSSHVDGNAHHVHRGTRGPESRAPKSTPSGPTDTVTNCFSGPSWRYSSAEWVWFIVVDSQPGRTRFSIKPVC